MVVDVEEVRNYSVDHVCVPTDRPIAAELQVEYFGVKIYGVDDKCAPLLVFWHNGNVLISC